MSGCTGNLLQKEQTILCNATQDKRLMLSDLTKSAALLRYIDIIDSKQVKLWGKWWLFVDMWTQCVSCLRKKLFRLYGADSASDALPSLRLQQDGMLQDTALRLERRGESVGEEVREEREGWSPRKPLSPSSPHSHWIISPQGLAESAQENVPHFHSETFPHKAPPQKAG